MCILSSTQQSCSSPWSELRHKNPTSVSLYRNPELLTLLDQTFCQLPVECSASNMLSINPVYVQRSVSSLHPKVTVCMITAVLHYVKTSLFFSAWPFIPMNPQYHEHTAPSTPPVRSLFISAQAAAGCDDTDDAVFMLITQQHQTLTSSAHTWCSSGKNLFLMFLNHYNLNTVS